MNDTSLKLEKCFSEKRQSLIDFYNGTINALDLATKISEFQLSILVYKRLRDELKQEFDDKIKVLDSLPHDMTKGIPKHYYVELDAQLKSLPLYRAILADYIGCDRILSNFKKSLALTKFEEKAGEEILYKTIQIKKKITILFDTIYNKKGHLKTYTRPGIQLIDEGIANIKEGIHMLCQDSSNFPKDLNLWENLQQLNLNPAFQQICSLIAKCNEDAFSDKLVFNCEAEKKKEYEEFLNNSCLYTSKEKNLFAINLYGHFKSLYKKEAKIYWTWIMHIVRAFYQGTTDNVQQNIGKQLRIHKLVYLEKIGLYYLAK